MYILNSQISFPPVQQASPDGLLCIGGDLSPQRLLHAYKSGIFPWYNDGDPILWWAPEQRMVVFPSNYTVPKKVRNVLNRKLYSVTFNQEFEKVIENCRFTIRNGNADTWLTDEMHAAYLQLYHMGVAKSVEVWNGEELVGGLYGLELNGVFCGESMFSKQSNASKYAFVALVEKLAHENFRLLDCQLYNDYLYQLGAREIPREEFMKVLRSG